MPRYLTPTQYRYAFDGLVDPTNVKTYPDVLLGAFISRAEAAIDAYFGWPLQFGGAEPHIVYGAQEAFDIDARRMRIPLAPVPARRILRFDLHVSNAGSGSGAMAGAVINPLDIAINNLDGYLEAIPLQAITYSLIPVVQGLGLEPPWIEMDYESGYYVPYSRDMLFDTGDGLTFRAMRGFWATEYTLTQSARPSASPPIPAVVYVNGVAKTAGVDYTADPVEGVVVFTSSQAGKTVQADYTAQIPDVIRGACVDQVTWLLQQRDLTQMGMGGIYLLQNRDQKLQRGRDNDASEDALCAKARKRLENYVEIPVAGA